MRAAVRNANEAVLIADAGRAVFANEAFRALRRRNGVPLSEVARPAERLDIELAELFEPAGVFRRHLERIAEERRSWRGELALRLPSGGTLPVAVRSEVVTSRDGAVLGFFLIFVDLTDSRRAAEARRHLEQSLTQAWGDDSPASGDDAAQDSGELIGAILANASLAAMDIADGNNGASVAPLLEEVEASTRRAAALYGRLRKFEL